MRHRTLVVTLVAALVLAGAPIAAASSPPSISVSQDAAGNVTISVTHNDTAAANATVSVTTGTNETYQGTGTYRTDANGTVSLPAPNETVNVTVTATVNNSTASVATTLQAAENRTDGGNETADRPFGLRLVSYLDTLNNSTDDPRGQLVSEWVREHNPGNPPAHAGNNSSGQGGPAGQGQGNGNGNGPGSNSGGGGDNGKATGKDDG